MTRKFEQTVILFSILTIFFASSSNAAEDTLVRVNSKPDNPWVGERVVLQVDVLARNGWAQLRSVRDTELEGGFLRRYETQGTRLNETIDGESYTGQRYEYLLFVLRPGEFTVPAIPVDIEIKTWGQGAGTKTKRSETPPLTVDVRKPVKLKSADGLISTTAFTAKQTWEPQVNELSAGDAITRTITFQAKDVTGMVFKPLQYEAMENVSAYPTEPVVNDNYNRGELDGERVEKITYVFEQGGDFSVPDFTFNWWNIKTEKLETITLAGKTIQVSGAPVVTDESILPTSKTKDFRLFAGSLVFCCIILILFLSLRSRLKTTFVAWKQTRRESESHYFKEVSKAARKNDTKTLLQASMRWLDQISTDTYPARMDLFLGRYGDDGADQMYHEMLMADSSQAVSSQTSQFYRTLAKARKNWQKIRRQKSKAEQLLPEIMLH